MPFAGVLCTWDLFFFFFFFFLEVGKLESPRLVQIPVGIQPCMAVKEVSSTDWIKEAKKEDVRKTIVDHSELMKSVFDF